MSDLPSRGEAARSLYSPTGEDAARKAIDIWEPIADAYASGRLVDREAMTEEHRTKRAWVDNPPAATRWVTEWVPVAAATGDTNE